jgi:hypothetical protein
VTRSFGKRRFSLVLLVILAVTAGACTRVVVVAPPTTTVISPFDNANVVAECQADAKTFETALETYKAEVGSYPGAGSGQTWAGQPAGTYGLLGNTANAANGDVWTSSGQTIGPFMRALASTPYYSIWTDGHGGVFVYPASQTTVPTTFAESRNFDTGRPCNSLSP